MPTVSDLRDPQTQQHTAQAFEAERAVLASALISEVALAQATQSLKSEDFFRVSHQLIFSALSDLQSAGKPADLVTVAARLGEQNQLERVGGAAELADLCGNVGYTGNVGAYVDLVVKASRTRRLATICRDTLQTIQSHPGLDADDLANATSSAILDAAQSKKARAPELIGDVMPKALNYIATAAKRGIELSTGLDRLDAITLGLGAGQLVIIGGRPGMGKTTLGMNMVADLGVRQKKAVGVFSLEMPVEHLTLKMLSSTGLVEFGAIRSGRLNQHQQLGVSRAANLLAGTKIYMSGPGRTDLNSFRAATRQLVHRHGIQVVFLDYLQILPSGLRNSENRTQEVSYISGALKALAADLDICIIAACQLNRDLTKTGGATGKTENRKPRLSDLRDSGSLEQDADTVILLWREDEADQDGNTVAELIVAKQRLGETATIPAIWQGKYSRYTEHRTAGPDTHGGQS